MNNSDFTLNQIRRVLPILIKKSGITHSSNYDYEVNSDNLVELNMDDFFIDYIIQEGNFLIIKFYYMAHYDELDSEKHYFKPLQEISTVKKYIDEL